MARPKDIDKQKVYEAKFVAYLERKKKKEQITLKNERTRTNK